ncbi:HCL393Cp [Eremothecium sinecaudum]|uniref:HCL393Cp n=1 Tax=Eremothecium sinecaudum TaxID=45286 RepID=A0A109UY80_9SACH|nr:HCL393Cp [Eremothecium sinecaudum]AMD19758.1 HCL393Cp [Eremothecium sinecaudum]
MGNSMGPGHEGNRLKALGDGAKTFLRKQRRSIIGKHTSSKKSDDSPTNNGTVKRSAVRGRSFTAFDAIHIPKRRARDQVVVGRKELPARSYSNSSVPEISGTSSGDYSRGDTDRWSPVEERSFSDSSHSLSAGNEKGQRDTILSLTPLEPSAAEEIPSSQLRDPQRSDGIISSLISAAQNAAQHLIIKPSGGGNAELNDAGSERVRNFAPSSENGINGDVRHFDTDNYDPWIQKQQQRLRPAVRSPSFLKHLDLMLSSNPCVDNANYMPVCTGNTPLSDNSANAGATQYSGNGWQSMTDNSELSTEEGLRDGNEESRVARDPAMPGGTERQIRPVANNVLQGNTSEARAMGSKSPIDNLAFLPYKANSAAAEIGNGELTLEFFDKSNEIKLPAKEGVNMSITAAPPVMRAPSFPLMEQSPEIATTFRSRQRGVTLPSKDFLHPRRYSDPTKFSTPHNLGKLDLSGSVRLEEVPTVRKVNKEAINEVENNTELNPKNSARFARSYSPSHVRLKRFPSLTFGAVKSSFYSADAELQNDNIIVGANSVAASVDKREDGFPGSIFDLDTKSYASSKRNYEFHILFKDREISPFERLIADYSCAWSRNILIQGRLYISTENLAFYSNILGYVSTAIIPLKEILQVEKKNTAGIFPNAIAFHTLQKKYVFASFISRDTTFEVIVNVWNQLVLGDTSSHKSNDKIGDLKEEGQSSNDIKGPDLEYRLHENYDSDENIYSGAGKGSIGYEGSDYEDDYTDSNILSELEVESINRYESGVLKAPSGSSISIIGAHEHAPTLPQYSTSPSERRIVQATVNAPVGKVAAVLFGDETSYLKGILTSLKCTDITEIGQLLQSKRRTYSYTKPINSPLGPSSTVCHITETVENFDADAYIIVSQISKTPDVPSGNSFQVRATFVLSWSENNCTNLEIYVGVEWTGKCWVKAAIEKGVFDGVDVTMKELVSILQKMLKPSKRSNFKQQNREPVSTFSLPTIGPSSHPPTPIQYVKQAGDNVVSDSININSPLGTVYQLLFGDDTSYIKRILEKQKVFELSEIPKFNEGKREYEYTRPLTNPLGPKSTRCYIQEQILNFNVDSHACIEQIGKTPDVPSGNSFAVHTRYYLSWGKNNSTNMLVVTNVEWTGRSWIKGAIEKGSVEGQKVGVKIMAEELKAIVETNSSTTVQRRATQKRKNSQRPKKSKSPKLTRVESKTIQKGGWNDRVSHINKVFPILDLNSSWTRIIILGILILILLTVLFPVLSFRSSKVNFSEPGKILINGFEYNYTPAINTLYDVDKDHKQKNQLEVLASAESSIWDWIDSRSGIVDAGKSLYSYRKSDDLVKNHKRQELREAIKIAELELEQLKERMESL